LIFTQKPNGSKYEKFVFETFCFELSIFFMLFQSILFYEDPLLSETNAFSDQLIIIDVGIIYIIGIYNIGI